MATFTSRPGEVIMRAIVTRSNKDGSYDQVGMSNCFITNEYKRMTYIHKAAREFSKGRPYKLEIYYNWNNRYKDPDKVLIVS